MNSYELSSSSTITPNYSSSPEPLSDQPSGKQDNQLPIPENKPISNYNITINVFNPEKGCNEKYPVTTSVTRAVPEPSPESGYCSSSQEKRSKSKVRRFTKPKSKQQMWAIGRGLTIKPSLLPFENVGLGLFADRDFKKGEYITWYDGKERFLIRKQRKKHLQNLKDSSHTKSFNWDMIIRGEKRAKKALKDEMGGGSFLNDPLDPFFVNVKFDVSDDPERHFIYIKATKDIKKGTELLLGYGDHYWKARGYPVARQYKIDQRPLYIKRLSNGGYEHYPRKLTLRRINHKG